jgi:hypothetical protein
MSTPRATQLGVKFSDDTKLSRAAAIKCFQIPSRRMRKAVSRSQLPTIWPTFPRTNVPVAILFQS